eukprot:GILI01015028.1.p1 GENE.GILI01015028.1~~GILI01015028.1.p1  ORF type:complete len:398 (-),score=49.56 GILI01015028.1:290-1483(-)
MTADGKRIARLLFCVTGVWASFFIWGLLQERIATMPYVVDGRPQKLRAPFVISYCQALFSVIVSISVWLAPALFAGASEGGAMTLPTDRAAELGADAKEQSLLPPRHHHHHHHHKHHAKKPLIHTLCDWSKFTRDSWLSVVSIGFTMTFGAPFGYAAIRSGMPFPVMMTVKLGKMIPIVVVSTLVYRVRYPMIKYVIAGLITAGVIWFTFADSAESPHAAVKEAGASTYVPIVGTILVICNLFMDGFTSSSQDVLVKTTQAHGNPLQLLSNVSCLAWTGLSLIVFEFLPFNHYTTPELSTALHFFAQAPDALYELVLMALLNAVGQVFIFQTITHFGSLTLTAITVTRKTGSVFLSIFINGHTLHFDQFCAMGLVLAGVALETYDSVKGKKKHGKKD